jgi:hypothetical protein
MKIVMVNLLVGRLLALELPRNVAHDGHPECGIASIDKTTLFFVNITQN